MQVVLVTGWPKEETWDGEVGRDINVFNVEHYISLYMNAVAESCSRLCDSLLIVSLSLSVCVSESSANANE